jgi:hypothetical protein
VLVTAAKTRNGASKITSEIDNKNQIEKQFMSSQVFYRTRSERVQKITVEEQFKSQNLESFDPITQEIYWQSLATTHTQLKRTESKNT